MVNTALHRLGALEKILPPIVLLTLLFFTIVKFAIVPYAGFYYNPENGIVSSVYIEALEGETLQVGDMITRVGSLLQQEAYNDLRQPLLAEMVHGEPIEIAIMRGEQPLTIDWVPPGLNLDEVIYRLLDIWWLAYVFWWTGTVTLLRIRPKDKRWILLVAFNYLTAVWLIVGTVSASHLWESSIILHMLIWLSMPVYLHLHWVFPQPLVTLPRFVWAALYGLGLLGAMVEFGQLVPIHFYFLPAIIAFVGPLLLIIGRLFARSQRSRELYIIMGGFAFALTPVLILVLFGIFADLPSMGAVSLLALPALPTSYFYAAKRRQKGWSTLRANRGVVSYLFFAFLVFLGTVFGAVIILLDLQEWFVLSSGLFVVGVGLLTHFGFEPFQRVFERRYLGITQSPERLPAFYLTHITTSLDKQTLTAVIEDEVLPSLLIRESVLFYMAADQQRFEPMLTFGLTDEQMPDLTQLALVRSYVEQEQFILPEPIDWIYVVLPLRLEGELMGLWLLGKRDPDDQYTTADLAIVEQLAAQTAIALTNISQSEQLRAFYQTSIARQEAERANLARFLHDDVLNELAALKVLSPSGNQLPQYDALITRIRHEVVGLRPAILTYGLWNAFEELVENVSQRVTSSQSRIGLLIPQTAVRYPIEVEEHLFRIVQQALENAVKHASAKNITLAGQITPARATLMIGDDGQGFAVTQPLTLSGFLSKKRFGLAGMYERCALIEGDLHINSSPELGTQVRVEWRMPENDHYK